MPVPGRVYRLLNDEFKAPWALESMSNHVLRCEARLDSRGMPYMHNWFEVSDVYVFYFCKLHDATEKPPPGGWGLFHESTRISCLIQEWPDKMRAGEIVPEGEDIPPGKVRDWAIKNCVKYVFLKDVMRYQEFLASALKPETHYYERDEQLERSKALNAARASTRRAERVQRAIQRRAIPNRMGPHVHRQYRPKKP